MKRLCLIFILTSAFCSLKSQIKALTESGREVILYDNGNWKYTDSANGGSGDSVDLKTNPTAFAKTSSSNFLVKSTIFNVGLSINPTKWIFRKPDGGDKAIEYEFSAKTKDIYGMMLTERTEIPLESMRHIALINAQKAAPDAHTVREEYRMVNGKKVLCLEIHGTIQSIRFVYLGYYYCNENGTMQMVSYTSEKLFPESKKEMEEFLNGLTEVNSRG